MKTSFLFVFARPPYASLQVQELLDMAMTAAAFDHPVSLLLIDDGVYNLTSGHRPELSDCKDIKPVFESLELYDIEQIFVEAESLSERNLTPKELGLAVELRNRSEIAVLLNQHRVIVNV